MKNKPDINDYKRFLERWTTEKYTTFQYLRFGQAFVKECCDRGTIIPAIFYETDEHKTDRRIREYIESGRYELELDMLTGELRGDENFDG